MAVDFAKTGEPARMGDDLKIQQWPHFMEKKNRRMRPYVSEKILGQLYDKVDKIDFQPVLTANFNRTILGAYRHDEETLIRARQIKTDYDTAMARIMTQHEIMTEFEVFSTFVLSHSNLLNAYKFHEQIGEASTALKDQYRAICFKEADAKGPDCRSEFVAALYTVTAQDFEHFKVHPSGTGPFISFPWIFQDVLGKIAASIGRKGVQPVIDYSPLGSKDAVQTITLRNKPQQDKTKFKSLAPAADIEVAGSTVHHGDLIELFDDAERATQSKSVNGGSNLAGDTTMSYQFAARRPQVERGGFTGQAATHHNYGQTVKVQHEDSAASYTTSDHELSESAQESSSPDKRPRPKAPRMVNGEKRPFEKSDESGGGSKDDAEKEEEEEVFITPDTRGSLQDRLAGIADADMSESETETE